jgi:hypothetical protein
MLREKSVVLIEQGCNALQHQEIGAFFGHF